MPQSSRECLAGRLGKVKEAKLFLQPSVAVTIGRNALLLCSSTPGNNVSTCDEDELYLRYALPVAQSEGAKRQLPS
jgi:hypothetical protein